MLSAHRAHANELTTLEISDYPRTAPNRTWLRNQVFTCKFCQEKLTVAAGPVMIWHFKHQRESTCRYERDKGSSQTPQHRAMIKTVYNWLKKSYPEADLETDVNLEPINRRIPDVVMHYMDDKMAFECQYSTLPLELLQERTNDLTQAGYFVTWIFDAEKWSSFIPHISWLYEQGFGVMRAKIDVLYEAAYEETHEIHTGKT